MNNCPICQGDIKIENKVVTGKTTNVYVCKRDECGEEFVESDHKIKEININFNK